MIDELSELPSGLSALPGTLAAKVLAGQAAYFAALSQYGLVRVSGRDPAGFLQGQLTCNLDETDPTRAVPGAACSPKGRVYATFLLVPDESGDIYLRMRRGLISGFIDTLSRYAALSRIELVDISDEINCIGLIGGPSPSSLPEEFALLPSASAEVLSHAGYRLICADGETPRHEIWLPGTDRDSALRKLGATISQAGSDGWELANIRAGLCELSTGLIGQFIPQMLNLDMIGGVSFKKGCYTGQEIVARTQYRGKSKRRTCLAKADCSTAPAPGTPLFNTSDGKQSGVVATAIQSEEKCCEMLVVIGTDAATDGSNRLGDADGPTLDFMDLPYGII